MICMRAIPFCLVFLRLIPTGSGSNDWTLKDQKDGISVYSRRSELSKFNDIEVEIDLPGTVAQLSSILLDVQKYPQWVYSTKSSALMEKTGQRECVYYSEISVPWPLTNRDFYAELVLSNDSVQHSSRLVSRGMKDFQPEKKGLVRIPWSRAIWNITQKSDKMIHVQYVLQVDPGGSLPAWIANLFASKGPIESFENLKRKMVELNRD